MFKVTVAIALFALLFVTVSAYNVKRRPLKLSKRETFREFYPDSPVRDAIAFIADSFAQAFRPFSTQTEPEPLDIYMRTQMKSMRINELRKAHKNHPWDYDDINEQFERHFGIIRSHPVPLETVAPPSLAVEASQGEDAIQFFGNSVGQAFSRMNRDTWDTEMAPPFHHAPLSKLRRVMREDPDYFH